MTNPFLSILSTQDLNRKVDELIKTWENYMSNPASGKENLKKFVRSEILKSWDRCQSIGLNPEQERAKSALTSDELKKLLSESDLLHAAKPIIDNIFEKLYGTGYLITLNDAQGKMIYLKGEPEVIRKTEKMNFSPGMDWSESAAGTNAIGTSIVSKKPIQVFAAEHFCKGFHPMTCSSSPIFHPYTKNVIGAIDFTGLWPSTQPHTLGLAVSLAKIIEQELFSIYKEKYQYLKEFFSHCKNKWKDNPLLVLSDENVPVNGDSNLLKILNSKEPEFLKTNVQKTEIPKSKEKIFYKTSFYPGFIHKLERHGYELIHFESIVHKNKVIGSLIVFKEKQPKSVNIFRINRDRTIIGESAVMKNILRKCYQLASVNTPILLTGETGTGKELIARYLHENSTRKHKPFIAINCGAIPKDLIGSELFGYEGGTFTGSKKEGKKGKFEEADGGTIFLDEIGEMPVDLQVHLLRVLQEKEVTRLGSVKNIKVDIKVIAATNKDLSVMVEKGLFRKDLFFRLNVISITVPSLKEREEDILPIANYYLKHFAKKYNKMSPIYLDDEVKNIFLNYTWPGNIRELRNIIEHAVIFSNSETITKIHLPEYLNLKADEEQISTEKQFNLTPIEKAEMEQIKTLLIQTGWNKTAVSKELKIARSTLYRKLRKYNLTHPLHQTQT